MRYILSVCLALLATFVQAGDGARVEALQQQAWMQRGEVTTPLQVGMTINSEDKINTGKDARLILRLPDGSLFKLGEYAQVKLAVLLPPEQNGGTFKAGVDMLRGAFRYTSQHTGRRDVQIRIRKNITVGIRGTDVWGASQRLGRDLVCLLDGQIEVKAGGQDFVLDQALQFVVVPEGQPPLPVGFLDPEKGKLWMQETELDVEAQRRKPKD